VNSHDVTSALYWLPWLNLLKNIGAVLVVVGVAGELLGDWFSTPLSKRVDDARTEEIARLNNEAVRLSAEITASGERAAQARAAIAEAHARAAEANKVAEEERHARVNLESQLQPRTLSKEQWDMIQGLRGKLAAVSLVHETNFEAQWFANQFALAFISAGIGFAWYRRAPDVHTAGIWVCDPRAFVNPDGPPTAGEPLVSIFRKSDAFASVAVTDKLPTDVSAPPEIPALIIGGRFMLPLSHLPAYMTPDQLPADADPANETKKP